MRKLQGQMTEAANTDDTYTVGRFYICRKGRKYGNSPTEQRACGGTFKLLRYGNGPRPVRTHFVCKPPIMSNNCCRGFCTEVVIAGHAFMAVHTTGDVPTNSHSLPDLQSLCVFSHRNNPADGFVSRNNRITRNTPVVIQY